MNREVHFKSDAFNTTEQKPTFVNPGCYGDDVCRWMIEKLAPRGHVKSGTEPIGEDFGWAFEFSVDGVSYFFVVGHRPDYPDEPGDWIAWVERASLLAKLTFRSKQVSPKAIEVVNEVLSSSPDIRDLRWTPDST
ncbi:MAG: hypothetical protein U0229_06230 [Anaeromyxobacter sp.]